ncbi:class I SAM-dependent methyltransferase [candidate division KSB1 bacterium]|nr:class I SAM-dependent methyltransferase [candidate division KSB1 bacterium]
MSKSTSAINFMLEIAFDDIAAAYDAAEAGNPIFQWMRRRVQCAALSTFAHGGRILEIGCGTGTDALFFAEHGCRIVALDPSSEMVAVASEKILLAGFSDAVEFRQGDAKRIEELAKLYGAASFDGIFSNFGALNCVADLRPFARSAAHLLRPGGMMLLNIMPPICPWEIGYYLFKRQPAEAFRRWRGRSGTRGISVNVGHKKIQTYYHTRAAVVAAFLQSFEIEKQFALGVLAPPPYLQGITRYQKFFSVLLNFEKVMAGWPLLRNWGDHVVIVMRKRAN